MTASASRSQTAWSRKSSPLPGLAMNQRNGQSVWRGYESATITRTASGNSRVLLPHELWHAADFLHLRGYTPIVLDGLLATDIDVGERAAQPAHNLVRGEQRVRIGWAQHMRHSIPSTPATPI